MWLIIIIMLSITGVDDVDSAKGAKEMPKVSQKSTKMCPKNDTPKKIEKGGGASYFFHQKSMNKSAPKKACKHVDIVTDIGSQIDQKTMQVFLIISVFSPIFMDVSAINF